VLSAALDAGAAVGVIVVYFWYVRGLTRPLRMHRIEVGTVCNFLEMGQYSRVFSIGGETRYSSGPPIGHWNR
jgi:hypothetical protein